MRIAESGTPRWVPVRGRRASSKEGENNASLDARVAQRRKDLGRSYPPARVDEAIPKMRGAIRIEAFKFSRAHQ